MVTHDPRVLPFGDRIIHLEDGRILREERNSGSALLQAAFLGAPAAQANLSHEFSI